MSVFVWPAGGTDPFQALIWHSYREQVIMPQTR
jgi:hypothetical protein